MIIDMHVHSTFTEGAGHEPPEIIARARRARLDGICFTELDTIRGVDAVLDFARKLEYPVFHGVEVTTNRGHFLYYPQSIDLPFFREMAWSRGGEVDAQEFIHRATGEGGALVAAHPFDKEIDRPMGDHIFTLRGLHAVEAANGKRSRLCNELALEAANTLDLPCVAGSDTFSGLSALGSVATLFPGKIGSQEELVAALKDGAVWVARFQSQAALEDEPRQPGRRGRNRDQR